ncbi:small-conductance mechanosensitive channel [Luteibacter sp. 621]|uniref:mechanosensitive ion channel domain-containing protein n=1 Tax=Luteibacter sp. 621 TaxID=3373916 RepID=UPI003D213F73
MAIADSGLALGVGLLLVDFLAWRFTRVDRKATRIAMRLLLFAGLSYALWLLGIHPFDPLPDDPDAVEGSVDAALALVWWFQGAHLAALIARHLLPASWREERLTQDLASALVFLVALLGAVRSVFDVPIRGVLATSGAVAIVLGLAVQSTLADVFSGLVLNATQPFRLGDLVRIGETEGKVVQRNWRATTLLNENGNHVVVPNSVAAKADILNYSQPSNLHGVTVSIHIPHVHSPGVVLPALRHALQASMRALADPQASATAVSVGDRSIAYELVAYAPTAGTRGEVRSELIELACQHLAAEGVMTVTASDEGRRDTRALALLAGLELFSPLTMDELRTLAATATWVHFGPGETILDDDRDSTDGHALLVFARGVGSLDKPSGPHREVRRLGPGEALGRAGILTGAGAGVRVRAITAVDALRLAKADLTALLASRPEVARLMLDSLLDYQARAERQGNEPGRGPQHPDGFIRRLLEGVFRFHGLALPKADASPAAKPGDGALS